LDRKQAEQVARLLKVRPFPKGETVIMEGSGAAAFFLIDSGSAVVTTKGVHLATLGPGDCFGEIALIDGGLRCATVTAESDLVCYGLTFWEFRPLIERNGAIAWKLLQALAKRLRETDAKQTQAASTMPEMPIIPVHPPAFAASVSASL
jgi:CRP-like cAMP-binding protein